MTSQADYNLAVLAEGAFHRLGDYESLVFEGQTYRSGDLFDRACRVSGGLVKLGVSAGERVVVLMANCPEVGIAYSAIWRAGAVVTPVVFLVSPPELQHILTDSGAVAVVTTPELLATVTAAAAGAPQLRHVIVVGGAPDSLPGHVRGVDFAELESAPAAGIVPVSNDDLATLMYTGGTTGRAKGVMLSHRNLYYCSRSSHEASQAEGITRALTPLPLSHAYGMIVTLVGYHATERALGVLQRWFDPAGFLALAQQYQIQRTALVPAMVQMLLAQPLEDFDLSSLRYVNCGAAPLAAETREQWERRVPGSEILEGYGCTESGAVISVNPPRCQPSRLGRAAHSRLPGLDPRRQRHRCGGRGRRRDLRSRGRRDGRLLEFARGDRGDAARRLAAYRRYRPLRRRRLPVRGGQEEGPHHPRRLQRLPAGRGGHPAAASRGRDGGRCRPAGRAPWRGDRGVRVAAAGR